ncbi:two-component regulator propeller domain-containing protein [Pontibacter sp. G13]|uniref:ligand-binding sensor domain-containing protein n=1 Tax=Pontibacter sp. G13 TaxID=3074898 RepID=UPI00288C5E07|nr:two-component regulator propeller domain-containing protein [Pontibacter sp. G13]WNJ20556.1 two-component regulator propeller domain-containing protein [Pontibacter sp. G13]
MNCRDVFCRSFHAFKSSVGRIVGWLMLLCLFPACGLAQSYVIDAYGMERGLSQSSITDLCQDAYGMLWVGTQDGLNRFDGYQFTTYLNEPFDTNSLSGNRISRILCTKDGRVWVGTARAGLNILYPQTGEVIRIETGPEAHQIGNPFINTLIQGPEGGVWVGTSNGIYLIRDHLNAGTELCQIERFLVSEEEYDPWNYKGQQPGQVGQLFVDSDQQIWALAQGGVYRLDHLADDAPTFRQMELPWPSTDSRKRTSVYRMAEDMHRNLILSTSQGWMILRRGDQNWTIWEDHPAGLEDIWPSRMTRLSNGTMLFMTQDRGTYHVPFHFDNQTYAQSVEPFFRDIEEGFPDMWNWAIMEDDLNPDHLWVGTAMHGVVYLHPNRKPFEHDPLDDPEMESQFVRNMVELPNGDRWIVGEMGTMKISGDNRTFLPVGKNAGMVGSLPLQMGLGADGRIWQVSSYGFYELIPEGTPDRYARQIPLPKSLGKFNLFSLLAAPDGLIYLGTSKGVLCYNPTTSQFSDSLRSALDGMALTTGLFLDSKGRLWISTVYGLSVMEARDDPWKEFSTADMTHYVHEPDNPQSLRSGYLGNVVEDRTGQIWVASMNGLLKVEEHEDKPWTFQAFTTEHGMGNSTVYAVLSDSATHTLWMGTNRGIDRMDLATETFTNYTVEDGLQGYEYNQLAYFQTADGRMYFGGLDGYNVFRPAEIQAAEMTPQVWFVKLWIEGEEPVDLLDGKDTYFEFPADHKPMKFVFTGLNYAAPNETSYAYRLIKAKADTLPAWTEIDQHRAALLQSLPPGEYMLEVNAANEDGLWSDAPDRVYITILPPFWMTWPFWLLVAIGLGLAFWGVHALRLRNQLRRAEELERVRKSTAADFHDELGHKLTIISLFGEIVKGQLEPTQLKDSPHLDKIIKTANSLYYSMKDLLWVLDPDKDSVHDLVILLKDFGDELFDKTGIVFRAEGLREFMRQYPLTMDQKRHIALIFKEVMNNSLKHSGAQHTVLSAALANDRLTITFEDDGCGFDLETAKGGHGMLNLQVRADRIGGELHIDPRPQGTSVTLTVPIES